MMLRGLPVPLAHGKLRDMAMYAGRRFRARREHPPHLQPKSWAIVQRENPGRWPAKRLLHGAVLACTIAVPAPAQPAATIRVPRDFPTIQAAIDAASSRDEILVDPGTYPESIDFRGKDLWLRSTAGPSVTTILGGGYGTTSVVTFAGGEGPGAILEGFTITGGWSSTGGGIRIDLSSPIIRGNVITANSAGDVIQSGLGGGIYSSGGSPRIEENEVRANSAGSRYGLARGGGIYCSYGSPVIAGNVITGNTCNYGGGLYCRSATVRGNRIETNYGNFGGGVACEGTGNVLENNRISGNRPTLTSPTLGLGGGVYCAGVGGSARIEGNLITRNQAVSRGGGIACERATVEVVNDTVAGNYGGGLYVAYGSNVTAANTILWGDSAAVGPEIYVDANFLPCTLAIDHSDAEGGLAATFVATGSTLVWGAAMLAVDPAFADPTAPYHDLHLTYGSPCRDRGDATVVGAATDFEGDPRVALGGVDLGADEFHRHLYLTGDATPGGAIRFELVDVPGTGPIGLFLAGSVLSPPLPTPWGLLHIQPPIVPIAPLPPIPPDGHLRLPLTLPTVPPPPYDIPAQALLGAALSNLAVLEVR